jgi:membrane associated rhomboid family serine protease
MFPLRDNQPSYSTPVVTIALIVVNLLVFFYEISLGPLENAFIDQYGLTPDNFHVSAIFTSMFLHSGWFHVLGNMWFLWIFGDNIEDLLGHGKYLVFYLACGVAAAITQVFFSVDSTLPMVGASGAIAGVMGAYLVKYPRARILNLVFILIFFTTIDVPAWLILIYWFAIQFFSGVGSLGTYSNSQGGTAFFAHVGGFVVGIALVHLMAPRKPTYSYGDRY